MASILGFPFGFRPVIRDGGGPFSVTQYAKPATDTNAIVSFDIVQKVPGGVVLPDQPTFNVPVVQSAKTGTPGTTLWLGSSFGLGLPSTSSMHSVADETDCVFMAVAGSNIPITTAAFAGKNINLSNTAATAPRWTSKMSVNFNTVAADPTLDFRVRGLAMISPNADGVLGAWLEVTINKHFYGQGTPGI